MKRAFEVNLDGLVGPTHNYSGLSWGNEASLHFYNEPSNPRQAALQGLVKMKFMLDLGLKQGLLPPQERPLFPYLRKLGFQGTNEAILEQTKKHPKLISAVSSASSMWAANAATVTPSIDSAAKRVQFTPANLISKLHRSLETSATQDALKLIFPNPVFFQHHDPLPSNEIFSDEGAANHIRLAKTHADPGVNLFAFGSSRFSKNAQAPVKYPARQSKEATEALIRLHQIYDKQTLIAQMNPKAIDEGVFHLDVIATGNENLLFLHEEAFVNTKEVIDQLTQKLETHSDGRLIPLIVPKHEISLGTAVSTFLFNSQIVTLPDGQMTLIAPAECQKDPDVKGFLDHIEQDAGNPIKDIYYLDLKQSMQNGGGPACLRLRTVLNETEFAEMNKELLLTEELYNKLVAWVTQHYRESLTPNDLLDPLLAGETYKALDALTQILNIGSFYEFQK